MTYRTVMVVADAAEGCEQRVRLAAQVATDFEAVLVGVAAQTISGNFYSAIGESYGMTADLIESQEALLKQDLQKAESHFRAATAGMARPAEWFSREAASVAAINDEAARADLIVAGRRAGNTFAFNRGESAADLLLMTGRPVLVAPPQVEHVDGDTVLIAWKDTREARRAVADALPFLHRANHIVLAWTPDDPDDGDDAPSVGRICGYLARHGITPEIEPLVPEKGDVGGRLIRAAQRLGAGLTVAGAYGHSRVREWTLGGVTERLMRASPLPTLMSH